MAINIQYINEDINIIIDLTSSDSSHSQKNKNIKICKWCNLLISKGSKSYHNECKKKYRAVIHRRKYAIRNSQKAIGNEGIYKHWAKESKD